MHLFHNKHELTFCWSRAAAIGATKPMGDEAGYPTNA
jgi:hypothetical protein